MKRLLRKDNPGNVLEGSEVNLLERAQHGDDLVLFIESSTYDEFIIFGNYVVDADSVSGLSLPHLNHGDVPDPRVLKFGSVCTSQYIYDSKNNNVLVKDWLDEGKTVTNVYASEANYRSFTWYTTRSYNELNELDELKRSGDQFKVRIVLAKEFAMILSPDIIYFPHQHRDYVIKTSAMLLPTDLARDPAQFASSGARLIDSAYFSLSYLSVASDGELIIVHKDWSQADDGHNDGLREGTKLYGKEGRTKTTVVRCQHSILIPVPG